MLELIILFNRYDIFYKARISFHLSLNADVADKTGIAVMVGNFHLSKIAVENETSQKETLPIVLGNPF